MRIALAITTLAVCAGCGAPIVTPTPAPQQVLPTLTSQPTNTPVPPTATRAPTRAPQVTPTSGLLSSLLSSPTPGIRQSATVAPTVTPAPTLSPTAQSTEAPKATTTVNAIVAVATDTPEPQPTAAPSPTREVSVPPPTARPLPTRTPLPTSPPPTAPPPTSPPPTSGPPGILYDTPVLVNPPSGQRHTGMTGPAISWQSLRSGLQPLDYYAFVVHHKSGWDVRCYKGSAAEMPEYLAILQPLGGYDGFVVVMRLKAPVAEGASCDGDMVSYKSNISNFYWTRQ